MKTQNLLGALLLLLFTVQINAQDIVITTAELPATAQTFLKQHFANTAVHHVVKETGSYEKEYEVLLADGTEVEFTRKGEWKEVNGNGRVIPTTFISKSILDHVKTNYPTASITKIDKGHHIDVDLTNNMELEFSLNGKFLRID